MNNNDFYGNLDRIRKLYVKQNYDEAVKIADKMDFKRLKDWKYIAMLINLYEAVGRLEDVRYFCILAYNRNLGGKKLVYKLTKVMIRLEEIDEAEDLYDEYIQMAGRDNKRFELLYELKAVQGAKKTELIKILEDLMKRDLDEKYAYTLAELYAKTKQNDKCIRLCTRIADRFESGDVVDKANALRDTLLNPQTGVIAETTSLNAVRQAAARQEKAVGQNTIGLNVEQILAESAGSDMQNTGNMYTTQNIPVQDMYATQNIPVQDMYATQNIPVQDMYATQNIPVQDMYATQNIPVQDMAATQVIPVQDVALAQVIPVQDAALAQNIQEQSMAATQVIPVEDIKEQAHSTIEEQPVVPLSEEDIADLQANKSSAEPESVENNEETGITETAEEAEEKQAEIPEEKQTEIPEEADETEKTEATGNTVKVDTEAVSAAMQEAAATRVSDENEKQPQEATSDIESTMAMVEAALANETKAAQFDARMDMPEYTEEYTAPVKDKIVLRPFQPEIDRVYEIPDEVKRYFTKYSYVAGLEVKIGEYLESTRHEEKAGTSGIGNIIISGNRSSDKTNLAINIVKALNTLYPDNVRKIARTTGENINQRGIERSVGKLLGAALIIEEAGVIDRQRILELISVMESDTREMLIILEDSESEINELLKNNPELIEKFNHRITYKQFTVNELVEMCKRYADKCQYTIDEKALLQLYLRIDNIHSNSDGVNLQDVRDVIDVAIESAEKRAAKKLFGGIKKKKIGDREYTVLVESDFKE